MAQVCSGLCDRLKKESKAEKLKKFSKFLPGNFRYSNGQKWCALCAQYIKTESYLCPCCKTRLRSNRRNKNRAKMIAPLEVKQSKK
ncbi:MAG: hypothetical protein ACE5SV_04975 [Candidatus Nitrosomaritimum aestuariumsis]